MLGNAYPAFFHVKTPWGEQKYRIGDRETNPLDQWPDPFTFVHYPSRQNLAYQDSRNLNRTFPGRPDGNLTERTAFAITEMIRRERIDLTIDVHEASLGYPVVSTYVCHQRAEDMCAMASMILEAEQRFKMKTEVSPKTLRGLTHREIGDFTESFAVLMERLSRFIDKFVGPMTEDLLLTGRDEFEQTAAERGLLYADYDIKTAHRSTTAWRGISRAPRRSSSRWESSTGEADGRQLADLRGGHAARQRLLPARSGDGGSAQGVSELGTERHRRGGDRVGQKTEGRRQKTER